MAIIITDKFQLRQKNFLDDRQGIASSVSALKSWNFSTVPIPEGFEVYVGGVWYTYKSSNPDDPVTGKFKTRTDEEGVDDLKVRVTSLEFEDGRDVAQTFAQIKTEAFWKDSTGVSHARAGRIVTVTSDSANNGPWYLISSDYTKTGNWIKLIGRGDLVTTTGGAAVSDTSVYTSAKIDSTFPKKTSTENITAKWIFKENQVFEKDLTTNTIHATIGTITNLNSTTSNITDLTSETASIETGTITNLDSTTSNISDLTSETANIGTGTITNLNSTSGTITNLNSTTSNISNLTSETANIETGTITNLNSTTSNISDLISETANIETGTITNLNSTTGTITNLNSTTSNISNLTSRTANIGTGTIINLSSTTGTITNLDSTTSNISDLTSETASIETGTITNLNSTSGTITSLNSTTSNISDLTSRTANIETGTITNLNSTTGTITNLNSTTSNISNLTSRTANIETGTITNLNSTTSNISNLTSGAANIGTGTITNLNSINSNATNQTVTGRLTSTGETVLKEAKIGTNGSIKDEDGKTVARVDKIVAGESEIEDLDQQIINRMGLIGVGNFLKNTSFSGEFDSLDLIDDSSVGDSTVVFNSKYDNWNVVPGAHIVDDPDSVTGHSMRLDSSTSSISQETIMSLNKDSSYIISWKQKGTVRVEVGSYELDVKIILQTPNYKFCYALINPTVTRKELVVFYGGPGNVFEIKFEEGITPTSWFPSVLDTDPLADELYRFEYLRESFLDHPEGNDLTISNVFLRNQIKLGDIIDGQITDVYGGISGIVSDGNDVMIWSGSTFEKANELLTYIKNNESYLDNLTPAQLKDLTKSIITLNYKSIFTDIYAVGKFKGKHLGEDGNELCSYPRLTGFLPSSSGKIGFTGGRLNKISGSYPTSIDFGGTTINFNAGLCTVSEGQYTIGTGSTIEGISQLHLIFHEGYLTKISSVKDYNSTYYWY